jgi:hypothetical protein
MRALKGNATERSDAIRPTRNVDNASQGWREAQKIAYCTVKPAGIEDASLT